MPVKRHKRVCPYKECGCYKCQLVEKGRFVVAKQIAIYRDQTANSITDKNGSSTSASAASAGSSSVSLSASLGVSNGAAGDAFAAIKTEIGVAGENGANAATTPATNGSRTAAGQPEGPHCRRCRNHNLNVVWKGHKKICPFQNCRCNPCRLIDERKDTEKALREVADDGPRQPEPPAPGLFEIPHPKLSSPMKLSPCPSFAMTCESMGWRPDPASSTSAGIPHLEHVMKGSGGANGLYLGSCRPITCELASSGLRKSVA